MMKAKLDKLLLHFCNSSLNRETPEGKGSNFKGKRIQQPHTSYAHKSHYIGQSSQFAQQQLYRPPPMTRAQYMYQQENDPPMLVDPKYTGYSYSVYWQYTSQEYEEERDHFDYEMDWEEHPLNEEGIHFGMRNTKFNYTTSTPVEPTCTSNPTTTTPTTKHATSSPTTTQPSSWKTTPIPTYLYQSGSASTWSCSQRSQTHIP